MKIAETESLLRVVLSKEDIHVESSEAQYYISNIYGHEAKLDILAKDQQGKAYNVEVQRVLSGASVQRARFNGAMVDVMLLKKGEPHQNLPDRYTIFITETDMFGEGLPAYHACTNPLLKERVRYLKETEGGRNKMCQIMENRVNEEKIELAKQAIRRGKLSLADIAETIGLPLAFVEELARQKTA